MAGETALRRLIYDHPIIDNHAHNILKADSASNYSKYPFEAITSEAQGESLETHAANSLALIRAVNQLAELFGCAPELSAIKSAREKEIENDYDDLVRKCLAGTHMLLIDDGLPPGDMEAYSWHDQFTNAASKRIVRIEATAALIIGELLEARNISRPSPPLAEPERLTHFWDAFRASFLTVINNALDDPAVVGFKSVVCYRTGLAIEKSSPEKLFTTFETYFRSFVESGETRIQNKPLNDYLVISALDQISKRPRSLRKPIQFHTGLGDSDINLLRSNPAHLQNLIEEYPDVDFVLLHSSYPYTREAGYLASIYANTYLDIGEVFPMTSRDAQLSVLRQSLELVPSTKLLWSTDGHYHPETFWLANRQFRQALDTVFTEYVHHGDYTYDKAMDSVRDILFFNSNRLYRLDQAPDSLHFDSNSLQACGIGPALFQTASAHTPEDILKKFLSKKSVDFIWMQWVDYTATVRVRMFPVREFSKIVRSKQRVGIGLAVMNMLQTDKLVAPEPLTAGSFILTPDVSTLCRNVGLSSSSATVMTFWKNEAGGDLEGCPRTTLQSIVNRCQSEYGIKTLVGFEIEVVFMKISQSKDGSSTTYSRWFTNHSWSNLTAENVQALQMIEKIVDKLADIDIRVQQFHPESSPGQFEFVLPPSTPLTACDTLIKARQTITDIAAQYGVRATLHPRPFANAAGTAAHAHISITPPILRDNFLAGILHNLPSVLPFTLPQDASYERVVEGIWAGGVWVAWGYQNRETPIREVSAGHWEFKSMDGLANPYLAVAAIIGAGYLGMKGRMPLTIKGCDVDTATLSPSERAALSITTRMPSSLEESLRALEANPDLQALLGLDFVRRYIGVRRGEHEMLSAMGAEERWNWLIARY
ncbi:glutamine synthetase [Blastomyces gilchristii SLH14081]|uniref:Glutamine synthetase n=2 Tax=Blastomyces TaxID=229219 RepID=A0A179U8P1_BLAGS|nr:glutamine synthetase [Blastomyces gilchristii SLH14081]EGE82740.1 glutamine synthetase [Blastomyces dermatitidis ATCC 18188]OAT04200.1 glutamine synthetase [Blastomyces gilchristii SLH14081]